VTDRVTKPTRTPITTKVQRVSRVSPHVVRLVLAGEGLRGFPVGAFTDHYVKLLFTDHYVKLLFPPVTRTFTVRDFETGSSTLTIDFVVHGDSGIAGPWAARAQPGDEIALLGPGGGYAPNIAADWHLLVGDASALPAIAVALQRIPAERAAHVLIEVDSADEQQPLPSDADTHIHWVCRTSSELVDSVRAFEFPLASRTPLCTARRAPYGRCADTCWSTAAYPRRRCRPRAIGSVAAPTRAGVRTSRSGSGKSRSTSAKPA